MRRDVTHGRIRTENGRINPQSAHGMRPQGAACRAGGLRTDGRRPVIGDGDSFRPFLVPRAGSELRVENRLLAEIYARPSFTRLLTLAEPQSRQSRGRASNSPLESSSYLERRSPYSMLAHLTADHGLRPRLWKQRTGAWVKPGWAAQIQE
jgi:hypothetical protein